MRAYYSDSSSTQYMRFHDDASEGQRVKPRKDYKNLSMI